MAMHATPASTNSRPPRLPARPAWSLLAIASILLALSSLHYLRPDMPSGFIEQLPVYRAYAPWFLLHVTGGIIALLSGPWQFLRGMRARWPGLHRALGWSYVLGVLLGTLGGLYMARLAFGGFPVQLSFTLLALIWPTTTLVALSHALRGNLPAHRRWMVRSYALSFAAVTLRLWLLLLAPAVDFTTAYQAAAWLCWLPNLLWAQWWLGKDGKRVQ